MVKPTHTNPELVKVHVTFDRAVWEGLTSIVALNKARRHSSRRQQQTFGELMTKLGKQYLRKTEAIAALRAVGSPHADTFANK